MRFYLNEVTLLITLLLLAGCSHLDTQSAVADDIAHNPLALTLYQPSHLADTATEAKYRPIPADTLFSLLVAEVAGQRQDYKTALATYLYQAKQTQDPALAERTVNIAIFVGSKAYAIAGLKIWLEAEPNNPTVHQTAAQVFMESGDFKQALQHIYALQQLTGVSQYDYWATQLSDVPRDQLKNLLAQLHQIKTDQRDNASLWYAEGIVLLHLQKNDLALECIEHSLKLKPNFLPAALQKARVLTIQGKADEALIWLNKIHKKHPNSKSIQVLKARILLEQHQLLAAHDTFEQLHQNFPEDAAVLLSLALVKEELGQREAAKDTFYQLLATEEHVSEAHFYLARMADEEGDGDTALDHYQQLTPPSREFLPAQVRLAYLIKGQYGLDDGMAFLQERSLEYPEYKPELTNIEIDLLIDGRAYKLAKAKLDQLIQAQPNSPELLYGRAMLAEKIGNIAALERDLRHILKLNPNSTEALNALGYTLADKTQRYQEALELIQKAYEIDPQSPAIMDSLGWIYFRLNDYDKALPLLEAAFAKVADHEIAAHLGEVYWLLGQQQQAKDTWLKGLEHDANSPIINNTLERLKVQLENVQP